MMTPACFCPLVEDAPLSAQDFFNSARAIRTGLWLARHLSPAAGYRFADAVAGMLGRRVRSPLVRTTAYNQRMVLGAQTPDAVIAQATRNVFRRAGRAYFDLYRALAVGKQAVLDAVTFLPQAEAALDVLTAHPQGSIIISPHISNFDLAGLAFATRDHPTLLLAYPTPTSGYDVQNQIRRDWGFEVLPIAVGALRQAMRHLKQGGMLITGIDRPDPLGSGERLPFFGRAARLPTGHVRLALQTGALLALAHCYADPAQPHHYIIDIAPPFHLEPGEDRRQSISDHAAKILAASETIIRAHHEEWLMFYTIWDEQPG